MARTKQKYCPYREGILCDGIPSCEQCGWNPDEETRRIHEIREERRRYTFVRRSFVPGEHTQRFYKGGVR